MLWDFPGWYSLSVSYGAANDMHFTVWIALLVLVLREFWELHYYICTALTLVALVSQIFLVLALQGAYSIDVFGALVFGHFFWSVGYHYSYLIDVNVFGLVF